MIPKYHDNWVIMMVENKKIMLTRVRIVKYIIILTFWAEEAFMKQNE